MVQNHHGRSPILVAVGRHGRTQGVVQEIGKLVNACLFRGSRQFLTKFEYTSQKAEILIVTGDTVALYELSAGNKYLLVVKATPPFQIHALSYFDGALGIFFCSLFFSAFGPGVFCTTVASFHKPWRQSFFPLVTPACVQFQSRQDGF